MTHKTDKKKPETIDAKTGTVDPTPRRIDLSNARDFRLEMAYLYRQCEQGKMDSGEMNKRIWALGEMLKAHAVFEMERRLQELEERASQAIPGQRLLERTLN